MSFILGETNVITLYGLDEGLKHMLLNTLHRFNRNYRYSAIGE